jgi:superfamily II DNA or RNA helicase
MWNKKAPLLLEDEYFEDFDVVFGDECHLFASEDNQGGGELMNIMSKLVNAKYRIGTTGTLKDSKVHHLILEGIFGQIYQTTTTREMMDQKKAAELYIKCLQLQYPEEERKMMRKKTYQEEMEFLIGHTARNRFISNLALSLRGNTLVLFERVEKHGKVLHGILETQVAKGRKLFFVHGATSTDDRNMVRTITEGETDAILVASYGTFSTGVNIRNIDNIIFASPTKAKIRVLQSIGRGLRLSARKTMVTLFDIADDLSFWNKAGTEVRDNYSLQHLTERVNFYNTEQFDYKMYKIQLEKSSTTEPL